MNVDEARRLYDSGLSFAQVGERVGYSATWLARRFKAAGIPVRPSGRPFTTPAPDVDLEELVRRRDAGWTFPRLARAYGLFDDAARARYLRAKGLPLRRAEPLEAASRSHPDLDQYAQRLPSATPTRSPDPAWGSPDRGRVGRLSGRRSRGLLPRPGNPVPVEHALDRRNDYLRDVGGDLVSCAGHDFVG